MEEAEEGGSGATNTPRMACPSLAAFSANRPTTLTALSGLCSIYEQREEDIKVGKRWGSDQHVNHHEWVKKAGKYLLESIIRDMGCEQEVDMQGATDQH